MNILSIGGGDRTKPVMQALETLPSPARDVLLIPSSCSTQGAYDRKVASAREFFHELGLGVRVLHAFNTAPTKTQLEHEIGCSAVLYGIGGNTPYMLDTMSKQQTDSMVTQSIQNGALYMGTSAGAMLPFRTMHSNVSARPASEEWEYSFLTGLGIIPAVAAVHADKHDQTPGGLRAESRLESLVSNFPANEKMGIAIGNDAAVQFGVNPSVILSKPLAKVHLLTRQDSSVHAEVVEHPEQISSFEPNF